MKQTLRDILHLEGFKNCKVIAGENGLGRLVQTASLMEVPDILPFVEANTLLITTLYPIASEKGKMATLIPALNNKQVAGICIKPMRYIDEIPQTMLDQAKELMFPIIELPPDANLSSYVNVVLSSVLDEQINQLKYRDQVHRSMVNLLLTGADIQSLTRKLAEITKKNITLMDREYQNICSVVFREQTSSWETITGAHGRRIEISSVQEPCILFPIQAGMNLFGYLFLEDCSSQDENVYMAVEQAAMLLATVFFRNDVDLMHHRIFKDSFLRGLLLGNVTSPSEITQKSEAYNVSFVFPMYVLILCLTDCEENQKHHFYNRLLNEQWLERQMRTMTGYRRGIHIVFCEDALIVLTRSHNEIPIEKLANKLKQEIDKYMSYNGRLGLGISLTMEGPEQIHRGYRQALSMLTIGYYIYQKSYVSSYSQNRIYELIERVADKELLRGYVNDKLGKILEYDQKNHTNLMETMKALIDTNFNYKKTAKMLFLHYNTVRYRAKKIQELGISFEQGQKLAEVVFAYNIYLWLMAVEESR